MVSGITTKFHHRDTMPFEMIQESYAVFFQPRIVKAFGAATGATARRIFSNPPMHEDAFAITGLIETEETVPTSWYKFLDHRQVTFE